MLRLYRAGDEAGILELFREVSGRPRSLAHWQWKYRDNPAGSIMPALAEDEDGRIVGHYVTIPAWARMDGKPCQVIQVIDAMVAASQRQGLKKPGLFVQLARFYYEEVDRRRAVDPDDPGLLWMGYGFPTATHLRLGERLLRYTRLAVVGSLAAPVDGVARGLPATWEDRAYDVRTGREVDAAADGLWSRCVDEMPTAIVRDARYLNWRYRDCPDQEYVVLSAVNRFTGTVDGVCVLRLGWQDRPVAVIADWLVPGRARAAGRALLKGVVEAAVAGNCETIAAWFPVQSAGYMDFVALGFRHVPTEYWLVARSFGAPVTPDEALPHWYYTLGDSDLV